MHKLRKQLFYSLIAFGSQVSLRRAKAQDADLQPATDTANFVKDFLTGEIAIAVAIIGIFWLAIERRNNTLNGYKIFGYLIVLILLFGGEDIVLAFKSVIQGG